MKCRVKLPDCDDPRMIAHLMSPASGFAVPKSSLGSYLKNDATSR